MSVLRGLHIMFILTEEPLLRMLTPKRGAKTKPNAGDPERVLGALPEMQDRLPTGLLRAVRTVRLRRGDKTGALPVL
jgi:hypothetical protein